MSYAIKDTSMMSYAIKDKPTMSHSMSDHYFNQIYLEYRPALNRFLLKLSGNPQDAADLLQETFLKYYKKNFYRSNSKMSDRGVEEVFLGDKSVLPEDFLSVQKGSCTESTKSWLFQTGYHLFIDNWRRRKKCLWYPLESIPEPVSEPSVSPESLFIQLEMKEGMHQVLSQLKPKAKTAVLLRVQTDATYQEIAAQMGCSENTVKTAIRRARFKMNKIMDAERIHYI